MTIRVLVVEDSPTQAETLRLDLEDAGYAAEVAANAEAALALLDAQEFDLVVSDIVMPGELDGYELCRRIKHGQRPALPVLLLTSLTDPKDIIHGLECGADNFLTKPYEKDVLLERLKLLIRNRKLSDRRRLAVGVQIYFMGREYTISSDREQILGLLVTTFEEAVRQNLELRRQEAELRKAEASLARYAGSLEQRLGTLIEAAPHPIGVVDRQGIIRAWNPAGERVFGWAQDEIVGRVNPTVPEEEFEAFNRNLDRLFRGEQVPSHEVVRLHKDGTRLAVDWSGTAMRDAFGQVETAWVMLVDISERKRAEAALRESEARMRSIFERALDAVISMDADGRCTFWNPAAAATFGWTRDEALGRPLGELIVPEQNRDAYVQGLKYFLEREASPLINQQLELVARRRDGREIPVEFTVIPVRSGDTWTFTAFLRDISERNEARAELEASERRLRRVVESDMMGIFFWDAAGEITDANDEFLRVIGYTREELETGQISWRELTPPEFVTRDEEALAELQQRGSCAPYEKEYVRKGGTRIPILIGAATMDGVTSRGVAFVHDISERRAAAETARASEERARMLLNSTAEGIYGIDLDGNCTFANEAAARLFGYPDSKWLLGKHMHSLVHHTRPNGMPYPDAECKAYLALKNGAGTHADDEFLWRADGTSFDAEYWSHPIRRGEEIIGAVVTFLDITERRKLEGQFRQSQKMESVGQLAGGVAHDFNNLLTVILGEAELATADASVSTAIAESLTEIRKAGERAAALTRQLLAFSRQQLVETTVFEPDALVTDLDKMLRRLIPANVTMSSDLSATDANVRMDRGQLEQVIVNLVVNSRDAMPNGGRLTLQSSIITLDEHESADVGGLPPGEYVMISVGDSGLGMTREVKSRLFEPFFTTKPRGEGTGLGLATCYGIVSSAGGRISVYSEVGLGTVMKVILPRVSELGTPAEVRESSVPHGLGETILLAEDEAAVRKIAARILRKRGFTVLEASSGEEALEVLAANTGRVDLLLTDMVMGGMNGRELADRVAALYPAIPVLFTTGYTADIALRRDLVKGGARVIHKPFTAESLVTKVSEVLAAGPRDPTP